MRILFVDRSTELKTVRDLDHSARGGMVTSLFKVTDYLARRGHYVSVLCDIEQEGQTKDGVNWVVEPAGAYDVLVANRGVGSGYGWIEAKARILWTHDLPHNGFIEEPKTIRAFAYTVFMSDYAERVWRAFYPTIGKSVTISNGVDKTLFKPDPDKDLRYLIYASAPNRGLKHLPLIADSISSRVSKDIYCRAFSRLSVLHPNEGEDSFDYKPIEDSIVDLRDPVPQHQFAAELGKAGLMILPSAYPEICSNVVLQALACGTPIVTTGNLGATPEWVRHRKNGMLTRFQPHDFMIHVLEITRNAVEVLEDEWLHLTLIGKAARTKVLTWDQVGARWERLLLKCRR